MRSSQTHTIVGRAGLDQKSGRYQKLKSERHAKLKSGRRVKSKSRCKVEEWATRKVEEWVTRKVEEWVTRKVEEWVKSCENHTRRWLPLRAHSASLGKLPPLGVPKLSR